MKIRDYAAQDELNWIRCRVLSFLDCSYFNDIMTERERYENDSICLVAEENDNIVGLLAETQYVENKLKKEGCAAMSNKRIYTAQDIYNLPGFLRIELIDNIIHTDDWTSLEIDDEVFDNPPSENNHVAYRLSVVKDK